MHVSQVKEHISQTRSDANNAARQVVQAHYFVLAITYFHGTPVTVRIICYRFAVSMLTGGSASVAWLGVSTHTHTHRMIDDRC